MGKGLVLGEEYVEFRELQKASMARVQSERRLSRDEAKDIGEG